MIGNHVNVLNDINSQTKFDNLNEREFLLHLFDALSDVMKENFQTFTFYVFSTHNPSILPGIIYENCDPDKIILLYVSEEKGFIPTELKPYFKAIFKSYMPYEPGGNIHSFTLGHIDEVVFSTDDLPKINDRKIDIFFSGNLHRNRSDIYRQFNILKYIPLFVLSNVIRGPLRNIFLKWFGSDFSSENLKRVISFTNGFMRGYSKTEYKEYLLKTKILLCPSGFVSPETFRLFEGLNAGCVVISEQLPKLEVYNDVPVIQVDSWKRGMTIAEELLSDPLKLEKIQNDGIQWWKNNCSYLAVAKKISKILAD